MERSTTWLLFLCCLLAGCGPDSREPVIDVQRPAPTGVAATLPATSDASEVVSMPRNSPASGTSCPLRHTTPCSSTEESITGVGERSGMASALAEPDHLLLGGDDLEPAIGQAAETKELFGQ